MALGPESMRLLQLDSKRAGVAEVEWCAERRNRIAVVLDSSQGF